jgi:signal transduction histidine kinase
MKKFIIITVALSLICGAAFYFISVPRSSSGTSSAGGILDLTGADFTSAHYNLDCDWEFYFGQLYTPEYFRQNKVEAVMSISARTSWLDAGFSHKGCATYRLIVKTSEPELLMLIPEISDSSIVYINGQKVFEAGQPGKTKEETIPGLRNAFVNIRPERGQIEIILQAANFGWRQNCFRNNIEIGRADVLYRDAFTRRVMVGLVIGVILTMFLYHAILFIYRKKEWIYLIFAAYCLAVALRFALEPNSLATLLMENGVTAGLHRLHNLFGIIQMALLFLFIHTTYNIPLRGRIRLTICGLCILIPLVTFSALPYGALDARLIFLSLVPIAMAVVSVARLKKIKENPYNSLYIFALLTYIIWSPVYLLVFSGVFYMPAAWNNLFLLLSQFVLLSISYAETKREAEELASKTDFFRKMNHAMRTPLTIISTNIQTAKRRPEEADELLTDSQAEIMKMAKMIDDALSDGGEVEARDG